MYPNTPETLYNCNWPSRSDILVPKASISAPQQEGPEDHYISSGRRNSPSISTPHALFCTSCIIFTEYLTKLVASSSVAWRFSYAVLARATSSEESSTFTAAALSWSCCLLWLAMRRLLSIQMRRTVMSAGLTPPILLA